MAEWRRCLRRLPAQLRRAKKGTPAALKYKGRDENRALCICVPMIGGLSLLKSLSGLGIGLVIATDDF